MSAMLELLLLLGVFSGILFLTYIVTKKLAVFKQGQFSGKNMHVIEVIQLGLGQYIYIVQIGKEYHLFSATKEKVQYCQRIDGENLHIEPIQNIDFKQYLTKYRHEKQENTDETK